MAHSNAWNDSYESEFTDDNYGYEIDDYLRKLILGIRERMEIDHVWKVSTTTDGVHNKLTMPVQSSAPAAVADTGFVYTRIISGKPELFYRDEDGNEVQLTSAGVPLPRAGKGLNGILKTTLSVDGIVEQGSEGDELKVKVIEIGDWNMDATASVSAAHGLTIANIRDISVVIRNDADTVHYPLSIVGSAVVGGFYAGSANVAMSRVGSGYFDSGDFNSTSYNRGWITIWYVEAEE